MMWMMRCLHYSRAITTDAKESEKEKKKEKERQVMAETSPLIKYSDELTDKIIAWYRKRIREDYAMHSLYNQLLRSATSVGANVAESQFSQSPSDYQNVAVKPLALAMGI